MLTNIRDEKTIQSYIDKMMEELDKEQERIESLIPIFIDYLIFYNAHIKNGREVYDHALSDQAPDEANKAWERFNELLEQYSILN